MIFKGQKNKKISKIIKLYILIVILFFPSFLSINIAHSASQNLDVTAVVVDENALPSSGSGTLTGTVVLTGNIFPGAKLTLLKDGVIVTTLVVGGDGKFQITMNNLSFGSYQVSLLAEDPQGVQSAPFTTNVNLQNTQPISLNNVLIPPTLSFKSTVISQSENINAYGYSVPNSTVSLELPGSGLLANANTDSNGYYQITTHSSLTPGTYLFRTKVKFKDVYSLYSKPVQVLIYNGPPVPGDVKDDGNPKPPPQFSSCMDFNKDRRVNLVDFSILLFWFNKSEPPSSVDCNKDRVIDIKDFSILMYFWTG